MRDAETRDEMNFQGLSRCSKTVDQGRLDPDIESLYQSALLPKYFYRCFMWATFSNSTRVGKGDLSIVEEKGVHLEVLFCANFLASTDRN